MPLENVSSNVFGDLRHYRNAIAHKGSRLAKPPVELTFVKVGQEVVLTQGEMKSLFILLFQAINQILLKHTGKDHGFRFERGTP